MAERRSDLLPSLLEFAPISRIRRNHGLEHATLNILTRRYPQLALAGHSDLNGFWILGNISVADLQSAILEALERLHGGEYKLAVHPNCGTNFVTSGLFAGGAASVAMFGAGQRLRDKLERIPLAATLATLALIVAQPLGLLVQERITTSGKPDSLEIAEIIPTQRGRFKAYRIITKG